MGAKTCLVLRQLNKMSEFEADVLRVLDRLLLQQGISGGELAHYYFPAVFPLSVTSQ